MTNDRMIIHFKLYHAWIFIRNCTTTSNRATEISPFFLLPKTFYCLARSAIFPFGREMSSVSHVICLLRDALFGRYLNHRGVACQCVHPHRAILLPMEYLGIFNHIFISNHELLQIRYRPLAVRQYNHIGIDATLPKSILIALDDCYAKCTHLPANPLGRDFFFFFMRYRIISLSREAGNNL